MLPFPAFAASTFGDPHARSRVSAYVGTLPGIAVPAARVSGAAAIAQTVDVHEVGGSIARRSMPLPPRPVPHAFGPTDISERAWIQAAALRPGALVEVSSADGGVGRSTLVAALGGLLALAVSGLVLAWP